MVDDGEGAWRVAQIERPQFEMEDDATWFDRIEATFAAIEQAGRSKASIVRGSGKCSPTSECGHCLSELA